MVSPPSCASTSATPNARIRSSTCWASIATSLSLTGRPWQALRTPAMTLSRLKGSTTPERFITERLVDSTVVNRRPHSGHSRRRRMEEPSSAAREPTAREAVCRQTGQYTPLSPSRIVTLMVLLKSTGVIAAARVSGAPSVAGDILLLPGGDVRRLQAVEFADLTHHPSEVLAGLRVRRCDRPQGVPGLHDHRCRLLRKLWGADQGPHDRARRDRGGEPQRDEHALAAQGKPVAARGRRRAHLPLTRLLRRLAGLSRPLGTRPLYHSRRRGTLLGLRDGGCEHRIGFEGRDRPRRRRGRRLAPALGAGNRCGRPGHVGGRRRGGELRAAREVRGALLRVFRRQIRRGRNYSEPGPEPHLRPARPHGIVHSQPKLPLLLSAVSERLHCHDLLLEHAFADTLVRT